MRYVPARLKYACLLASVVLLGIGTIALVCRDSDDTSSPVVLWDPTPVRHKQFGYPLPNRTYFRDQEVPSTAEIKQRILRECPQLAQAIESGNDIEVVRQLRHWAASTVDIGSELDYWLQLGKRARTLNHMVALFDNDALGVRCGDASRLLKHVYKAFGYQAELYNSGVYSSDPSSPFRSLGKTHVITLVEIEDGGEKVWIPEDTLFDVEYRLAGDECTAFRRLITALRRNPDIAVEVYSTNDVPDRKYLALDTSQVENCETFQQVAQHIEVRAEPWRGRWDKWIKPDGEADKLIRQVTGMKGHAAPYHCFLFPINSSFDFLSEEFSFDAQFNRHVAKGTAEQVLR